MTEAGFSAIIMPGLVNNGSVSKFNDIIWPIVAKLESEKLEIQETDFKTGRV